MALLVDSCQRWKYHFKIICLFIGLSYIMCVFSSSFFLFFNLDNLTKNHDFMSAYP